VVFDLLARVLRHDYTLVVCPPLAWRRSRRPSVPAWPGKRRGGLHM